jgi:gliding motility-associated-like protein
MTLKRLTLTLLSLCFVVNTQAQTTNAFRVNYNQALFDLPGNAVEALTLNNYVFAGTNMNFFPIYGTVTQVDASGLLVWSKSYYDGSFGFQINDIKKDAAANEYYVCGGSESNAGVFMRLNSLGNVVASTKFSISQADGAYFNRVIKTTDGGYVAVGYVTGYDPDGAGPEMDFVPFNYTDTDGASQTEIIGSPLIVKMDASGNHVWHKVFRYYDAVGKAPADRIYNDASFNDVTETTDGYIAVGSYDVNDVLSNTNSDGDDATANDALVLKTDFSGSVTYHIQYDALNFSPTQSSKYLTAINKTSTGVPIAAGSDNGREWVIKFNATGGFTSIFSRLYTYSTFFGTPDPVEVSQIYEVPGSTDLLTMGMYIRPLSFVFSNSVHRINSTATTNVWAKYYTFSLATILPRGSINADNSLIMASTVMGGANFDYHVIKTDPNGDTPLTGCAPVTFTPTTAAGTTTTATPHFNSFSGTVGPTALAVSVAPIAPTSSVQCSFVACTPPAAPTAAIATQPDCSTATGSITLTGLPTSGTWTVNGTPSGTATGNTSSTTISGLAPGNYTFTVTLAGCTSASSNSVTVNAAPTVPTAPVIGTITQTTCTVGTGSIALSGLPSSGTWTVTGTPSGSATGTGTTTTITGLAPGSYTFTVSNGTCTSVSSTSGVINAQPTVPTAPIVGAITQPTCSVTTGSVDLSGLPSSGSWTVTASPGGATTSGTGTSTTFSGLTGGSSYSFTVSNGSCSSGSSTSAAINAAPTVPTAPVIGTITQTNCASSTGSIELTGLPSSGTWTVTGTPSGSATGTGTTTTITGLASGSYTFTVSNGTCSSVSSMAGVINTQPTVPSAPIVGTITQPTCSTPTGSVDLNGLPASGTWTVTGTPSGSATGTGTTGTITGLTANATYTFTVSNGACSSTASTSAGINAAPIVPTAPLVGTITQPTCSSPTGTVALSGLPASGSWTVTASPGGTTISGTGTTANFTGLNPGNTYTFTVTNSTSCTSTTSTSAAINTVPGAPSTPVIGTVTQPTCSVATGSIELTGLPSSGTWTVTTTPGGTTTNGSGTSTTLTGLTSGTTYTFTVTNDLGCTSASSTNAVLNSAPTTPTAPLVGTITQPTCSTPTGSVDLSGLPASGTWTVTAAPGGVTATGTGTTGTITGLAANTTYTFTVSNGACSSTASTSAALNAAPIVPTAPLVGTITQPTCSSPTGTVALSGLPSSGSWTVTASPGGTTISGTGTTANFTGLNPGNTYTFTVTNSATCTSTASTSAATNTVPGAPSTPVIGTVTQPTCSVATGSIELTGLPSSGTWTVTTTPGGTTTNGSGTSTTLTGLTSGTTYTFTVTNDLGCTSASSTNAILNSAPSTPTAPLIGTITNPTCSESTGSVVLNGLPSSGSWTLTVSPGGTTQTGTGVSGTFSGLAANSTYTFTITNADGCVSTSSLNAAIAAQPTTPTAPIIGTVTQPVCTSPTGSVAISGLPSGSWTITATPGGSTINGTGSSADFTGLAPGNNFTFTVTNSDGCTSSASTSTSINSVPGAPSNPTAGTVSQPTCTVPTGSIEVSSPLGAQYTYSIDGANFSAGTTFSNLAPGSYSITVLDNGTGCSSVSVSSITIDPISGAPTITLASSTDVTCSGDSDGEISVSVTGGQAPYTYSWDPNAGSGATLSNIAGGSYEVTVTDDLGCSSTATFTISEPGNVEINGNSSNVICGTADGSINTSVTGGTSPYSFDWSPNGETTSSISGLAAGSYSVEVTDDNGCSASESYTILTTGFLPVSIDPSYVEIQEGESVQLTATGGENYTWTPSTGLSCTNCADPIASPTETTTYFVAATDDNGCVGGDSSVVVIKLPCGELFVPTIFSPNEVGPAANNKLCVYGTEACIEELKFEIYDRWGEKVFETDDISKCWDGTYKDKLMNSGIFVYRLYVKLYNNDEPINISGNTTLVR